MPVTIIPAWQAEFFFIYKLRFLLKHTLHTRTLGEAWME